MAELQIKAQSKLKKLKRIEKLLGKILSDLELVEMSLDVSDQSEVLSYLQEGIIYLNKSSALFKVKIEELEKK